MACGPSTWPKPLQLAFGLLIASLIIFAPLPSSFNQVFDSRRLEVSSWTEDPKVTTLIDGNGNELVAAAPGTDSTQGNLSGLIRTLIALIFAFKYKQDVVDRIPRLHPRPMSGAVDHTQGLFDCCGDRDLCLHSVCCVDCRLAHSLHVAGVIEFWPALALLYGSFFLSLCCGPCIVLTYYRMQIKRQLGIHPNLVMDALVSVCCSACGVGQQALAVDEATGVRVTCCCNLFVLQPQAVQGQPVVGTAVHVSQNLPFTASAPSAPQL
jgi:Cys-rich protein (TIGR01571 family)